MKPPEIGAEHRQARLALARRQMVDALVEHASRHTITVEGPITYPGGKDGFYRASCSQGDYQSDYAPHDEALAAGQQHAFARHIEFGENRSALVTQLLELAVTLPADDLEMLLVLAGKLAELNAR